MKWFPLLFFCLVWTVSGFRTAYADAPCNEIGTDELPQWFGEISAALEHVNHQTEPHRGRGIDVSAVYGRESREQVMTPVFPWTAVGQLSNGCTGTLVGECVVLTAAHCVHFDENRNALDLGFQPRFDILHFYDMTKVITAESWQIPDKERAKMIKDRTLPDHTDWALVKVQGKPGIKNGQVGIKWDWLRSRSLTEVKKIYVAGYSQDFANAKLSVDQDAKALELREDAGHKVFMYRADTSTGSSGGPVFDDQFNIIGVNTRAVVGNDGRIPYPLPDKEGEDKAIGVPTDYFIDSLLKLRSEKCDD